MKKNIQEWLISFIKETLEELFAHSSLKEEVYLDLPTDSRFGDLSTNIALRLSKIARKSPPETAELILPRLKKHIENTELKKYIKDIKAEGAGFINFYFSQVFFHEQLKNVIIKGKDALRLGLGENKPVLIEFVSANPTGSLSVAHARQAAVGDALANILEFLGFKVKREYYLNDEGNQINILGSSVELRMKELNGEKIEFPDNYYQGSYIYDIAKEIKNKKLKIKNYGEYAADFILGIIKKELDDFGVIFDYWTSQKKLRESGEIEKALEFLKKKEFIYEQEGALWFKSTAFGDDKDRVVVKSDNSYTYLAPDIAYHQGKYSRGFQWLINLWGPDHHGYIGRLKAAVSALGHRAESLSIIIVQLATISRGGLPVQMSTRKGQYIRLREVLDEVGKDAARFFFLMRRTSSHLDFDLEVAKRQTPENPVYYIQYAHARICSILRSNSEKPKLANADLSLLNEKEEVDLIKKILHFPWVLNICYQTVDPFMLTVYLQELSQDFHKFYDLHRVLGQDDKLTEARIALIEGARVVIACGLELLSVSQPESM